MRTLLNTVCGLFLLCFVLESHAIQVSVRTAAKEAYGIGFTANGKDYGSSGKSYTRKDLPAGEYSFGFRANGLIFGDDISCFTRDGKKFIKVTSDTTATLFYDGKHCTLQLDH